MVFSDNEIEKITDFALKYLPYNVPKSVVADYIKQHVGYGTFFVLYDNVDEIVAIARWNISEDGDTADILDFAIRPDWRKYNRLLMRQMLFKGWWGFPKVKRFTFERGFKYPYKERKYYNMKQFLGIKEE